MPLLLAFGTFLILTMTMVVEHTYILIGFSQLLSPGVTGWNPDFGTSLPRQAVFFFIMTWYEGSSEEGKRSCVNCRTTKTPLWRGGPAGPKSLCNACGMIRTRKKSSPAGAAPNKIAISNKKSGKSTKIGSSLKQRLLALRREVLMKGWRNDRTFGEVEQAAALLLKLLNSSAA